MFYDNLPGINVTLKDGGLIIPERGGSESILIIAPSLSKDAPEEPVVIRSSNELQQAGFGDFYVNGEINPIAAEWKAAADSGARVIYLAALKEVAKAYATELEDNAIATAVANGDDQIEAEAKFKGVLTGTQEQHEMRRKFVYFYEMLMSNLLDFDVEHVVVKGVTIEDEVDRLAGDFFPEIENADLFPNIAGMNITSHIVESKSIDYPLSIETGISDTLAFVVGGTTFTLTLPAKEYDGADVTVRDLMRDVQAELDKDELLNAKVQEESGKLWFHFAEAASVASASTAVFAEVGQASVIKKTQQGLIVKGSFAKTLADYCAQKTLMKSASLGYMGVKAPVDTKVSTIRKHVDRLMKLDTHISPYLQIVATEVGVVIPRTNATYFTNGATNYAALVSTLPKEFAPTNKQVRGIQTVRYDFSLRQLSALTGKKLVTFRLKDGQLTVTDAITSAPPLYIAGKERDSDFARLSTLRITQLAIEVVREAVDPFVGAANDMPMYNAMNTAIKSSLERLREVGAIRGYNFRIVNLRERLDEATVVLNIVPAFELRRVEVQVSLSPSDEVLNAFQQDTLS